MDETEPTATEPNGRRRVLAVSMRLPEDPPSGGEIRTKRFFDALDRAYELRTVGYSVDAPPPSQVSAAAKALVTRRPYQTTRYATRELARRVEAEVAAFGPHFLYVDHEQVAPLAFDIDLPAVLDLHEVRSVFAQNFAASSKSRLGRYLARRDGRLLAGVEERCARHFDLILVPSAKEAERIGGNVHVVPNGADPSRVPLHVEPDRTVACFVGLFSFAVNVDGALWLAQEVLPILPEAIRVQLVGRDPVPQVRKLAGSRIEVTGTVPATWPYVCSANVVLAPLLMPGGVRHKILEGLLATRPVLATSAAVEGLEDLVGEGVVIADTPEDYAAAIVRLYEDPAEADRLGQIGRQAVVERHAWEGIEERLIATIEGEIAAD